MVDWRSGQRLNAGIFRVRPVCLPDTLHPAVRQVAQSRTSFRKAGPPGVFFSRVRPVLPRNLPQTVPQIGPTASGYCRAWS